MIRLTCTNCKANLELDDAFAGGVCRCQHCGTIQTVPSHAKNPAGSAHPKAPPVVKSKSLYQGRPAGGATPSSGLDDLANAVASSGLTGRSQAPRREKPRPPTATTSRRSSRSSTPEAPPPAAIEYETPAKRGGGGMAWVLVGVLTLVLLAAGAFFVFSVRAPSPGTTAIMPNPTPSVTGGGPDAAPLTGPHFLSVPLTAPRVVFVIDRGDASRSLFDPLKNALYKSLESLGAERQFQVIFWRRGTDPSLEAGAYPAGNVAKATPDQVEACRKKFEDLTASGATDIDDAIRAAVARRPGEIVVATAKGSLLDETVMTAVDQARGSLNVKIHTVALGGGGGSKVLQAVAEKTGGVYREVTDAELNAR